MNSSATALCGPCGDQCDLSHRHYLVIQVSMFDQETVVLSNGCPGLVRLWLAVNQRCEESALDVARGGRAERVGLGDGKFLLGWARDTALARAAVVEIVLIL